MSHRELEHPEDLLDAYLDGQLNDQQKRQFEERLAKDPALRAQVDQQAQVDRSLRRQMGVPDVQVILAAALAHAARAQPVRPSRAAASAKPSGPRHAALSRLAQGFGQLATQPLNLQSATAIIAAVLVISGVLGYVYKTGGRFVHRSPLAQPRDPAHQPALDSSYAVITAQRSRPASACPMTNDVTGFVKHVMGAGLVLESPPPDVQITGLELAPCADRLPHMAMVAQVQGSTVVVFIDRATPRTRPSLTPGTKLHAFEKQIGSLLLREISPLPEAHVLDLLEPVPGEASETQPH